MHSKVESIIKKNPKTFGAIGIIGKETLNILGDVVEVQNCILKGWSRIAIGDENTKNLGIYTTKQMDEFGKYISKKLEHVTPEQKLTALYGLALAAVVTKSEHMLYKHFEQKNI